MEVVLIDPERALELVASHCPRPVATHVAVEDALGHVLAEDVRSSLALPAFDNSAMDGFALRSQDAEGATRSRPARLQLGQPVYAGDVARRGLKRGSACAIMTGAPMPRGADTVIQKEIAVVEKDCLVVAAPVPLQRHVRKRGEEVARGEKLLAKGTLINAGIVGILATVGRSRVRVYRKPRVAVITTGDEAILPGRRLAHGQIYDSNTPMLVTMTRDAGFEVVRSRRVKDHVGGMTSAISAALRASDVVIISGGVSVGDRDYVRQVLDGIGVNEVFWRVKQKPGKPLRFATKGRRLVFGLPGNPAATFTCYYVYVYTALRQMAGFRDASLRGKMLELREPVARDAGRWRLLKARTLTGTKPGVVALSRQASHMISTLAQTDSLIAIPPGEDDAPVGELVKTYHLPGREVLGA
jgi:molybdopterin molybdotransferase